MWRWLKGLMTKRQRSGSGVAVEGRRAKTLREGIESTTEAITFAEAGLHEKALEILRARTAESSKVLVVGHEDAFSESVSDYAAEFAERMECEVVALNVTLTCIDCPRGGRALEFIEEQFRANCRKNIAPFREACRQRNITFTHLIMFGEINECIRETCKKLRRVECVITEPESCPETEALTVPVFCVTT